jgi:outer membrane protein OmpA-like peptidoglycan-associated protein
MRPMIPFSSSVVTARPRQGRRLAGVVCGALLASVGFFALAGTAQAKSTLTTDCLRMDRVEHTEATIYFATNSTKLSASDKAQLKKVADVGRYKMKLCVVGQADKQGNADYNKKLAEKRAIAIADYIASQGVSRSRIETGSRGESFSSAKFYGNEKQAQDRRVDVYFTSVAE